MNEMQFEIEIHASKEKVWATLWNDKTFRQWAGVIDPGTYMKGELEKGKEVEFISSENGYGVTSLVEKVVINEHLQLRHSVDTQGGGSKTREKEWQGGTEEYFLTETEGTTTLRVVFDVPTEMEDYFKTTYPKALEVVKSLAERG